MRQTLAQVITDDILFAMAKEKRTLVLSRFINTYPSERLQATFLGRGAWTPMLLPILLPPFFFSSATGMRGNTARSLILFITALMI